MSIEASVQFYDIKQVISQIESEATKNVEQVELVVTKLFAIIGKVFGDTAVVLHNELYETNPNWEFQKFLSAYFGIEDLSLSDSGELYKAWSVDDIAEKFKLNYQDELLYDKDWNEV